MAQTIEIAIPITMQDLNSGVQRWATPDEVRVSLICADNSLTHWPDEDGRDGGTCCWWEEPGVVVFAKLRGTGIYWNNFYLMRAEKEYEMTIDYQFDTAYQTKRRLYVNEDGSWAWTL